MEEARPLPAAPPDVVLDVPVPQHLPPIDPDAPATRTLLRGAVDEAVTLLRADGGLVYLLDPHRKALRMLEDAGVTDDETRAWARGLEIPVGAGMFGKAVAERRVVVTGDYATDHGFQHTPQTDRVAAESGMVSMVVAPLEAKYAVLGAIAVFSTRPAAYDDADIALVRSLAAHAAATVANEALIEALGRTATQLSRRSERERTLRELVGSLAAIRDPEELLRRVLLAVATVSGARGALVDRIDAKGRHTHVVLTRTDKGTVEHSVREPGHGDWGVMGRAMTERRLVATGDYLNDTRFVHTEASDEMARRVGIVSVVAAPLMVDGEIQGVLAAHSDKADAFDDEAIEMMSVFADHAAVAIANARRMEELDESRTDLARRASEERALREVGAKLASLRNPDAVLKEAVEAVCRLVGGEWAEIARLEPDQRMTWTHVYGLEDPELRVLQANLPLTLGEGILGRAAAMRQTLRTADYLNDASFVHRPKLDEFAAAAGFRSSIAAPFSAATTRSSASSRSTRASPTLSTRRMACPWTPSRASRWLAMGNARLIEACSTSPRRAIATCSRPRPTSSSRSTRPAPSPSSRARSTGSSAGVGGGHPRPTPTIIVQMPRPPRWAPPASAGASRG
ncbi:MAG: GAF domain-containing protein [Chloroflexota bacterium]